MTGDEHVARAEETASRRQQPKQRPLLEQQQQQPDEAVGRLVASLSHSDLHVEQRRELLNSLSVALCQTTRTHSFQAGLEHVAGDVQRTTLDAICQRKSVTTANGNDDGSQLLTAVMLVVKRCTSTPASLRTRSECRTCAAALRTLAVLMQGNEDHPSQAAATICRADVPILVRGLLACLAWGLSDAPGDDDHSHNAVVDRSIRQRSIACLHALNVNAGKGLLLFWPEILCEEGRSVGQASLLDVIASDTASSNRTAACRVLEAYMLTGTANGFFVGAEERTRLGAFTSLASRIAALVVQCRARLAAVLATLAGNAATATVAEAVLRCTTALIRATGQVRLRQTHAEVLRPVTSRLCASTEAPVAVRAYALLTALIANESASLPAGITVDAIMVALQDPHKPASIKAGAWNALAASKESHPSSVIELALEQLAPDVDESVRQAVADFVLTLLQRDAGLAGSRHLARRLADDSSPRIRAVAADCLGICAAKEARISLLATDDADSTVRAAAARAIGVAIQQSKEAIHVDALRRTLRNTSSLVRQRASWSWGNLCEAKPSIEYLVDCLALQGDDERIIVHAVRGIGALLADHIDWRDSTAVGEALQWLAAILRTSKDPKMRWNTCASLGRMLASSSSAQHVVEHDSGRALGIIALLSDVLAHDKTFKTRLTACQALQAVLSNVDPARLSYAAMALRADVSYAVQRIDEQTAKASFRESQLHAVPLQRALSKLADGNFFAADAAADAAQ